MRRHPSLLWAAAAGGVALAAAPASAEALRGDLGAVNTLDLWRSHGGLRIGSTFVNKFEVVGQATGGAGVTARARYFYVSGDGLSDELAGDLQGVDNNEADRTHRLIEAWVEAPLAEGASVRAGLIDLNAEFDAIGPAALFVNSSHGIGTEFATSGRSGPSIFPVTGLGVRAAVDRRWLGLRGAVVDGAPGDPRRPRALVDMRLGGSDGLLLAGEADLALPAGVRLAVGAWRYTRRQESLGDPGRSRSQGAYASLSAALPWKGAAAWARVGLADPDTAPVARQWSGGIVKAGPVASRPRDELGLAVSRAETSTGLRTFAGAGRAETVVELTYRFQATDRLSIQPDLQYVANPAAAAGTPDAVVVGLRLTLVAGRTPE